MKINIFPIKGFFTDFGNKYFIYKNKNISMILTEKVKINIHPSNMKYYISKGYSDIGVGDEIEMEINNIKNGSHCIITCKCDKCGKEKDIQFRAYLRYGNEFGKYLCRKCSQFKLEETNMKLYGKKYPAQREEIMDKMKLTMIDKYGVENASQSKELQNKKIETNTKNFGCNWGLSSEKIKNKSKKTCLEKYGVEYILQNKEIIEKNKKTILDKYGEKNYNNRKKYRKTCLEKYGVEHIFKNEIIKEKTKQTFLQKYQVEHVLQNEEIYKKMIRSSFKIKYYNNTPIYYQGSYEKNFLDKYFGKMTIMNGKTISYEMNGKKLKYYSDFYLPDYNMIIEIKSSRWYNIHLDKNIMKEKTCKELGYIFIFIIDKNYNEFENFLIKKGT